MIKHISKEKISSDESSLCGRIHKYPNRLHQTGGLFYRCLCNGVASNTAMACCVFEALTEDLYEYRYHDTVHTQHVNWLPYFALQ